MPVPHPSGHVWVVDVGDDLVVLLALGLLRGGAPGGLVGAALLLVAALFRLLRRRGGAPLLELIGDAEIAHHRARVAALVAGPPLADPAAHGQAHVALRGIAPGHRLHLGAEQLAVKPLGGGQRGPAGPGECGPFAAARSIDALSEVGEHLLGGAPLIIGSHR